MWGALAVTLAVGLDRVVAEPPARVHPVALLGRTVAALDREWARPTLAGAVVAVAVPLVAGAVVWSTTRVAAGTGPLGGSVVAGLWLFALSSRRMLTDLATAVVDRTATDLEGARSRVRGLVGRDASSLDAAELRSGAVESAAENLADGLVAPLVAFALGAQVSLAAAAGAAGWVKAVNTLDSMLGYPSKPHGTASARLDDAVMWLPARASALLLAVAARDPGALRRGAAWAHAPSSPNSGWPMATLAAALDVRLRKPGAYDLNPTAGLPTVDEARRGVGVVADAGGFAALLAAALAGVGTW
jgi:adenosylcobinamide-phosphate synthase